MCENTKFFIFHILDIIQDNIIKIFLKEENLLAIEVYIKITSY